MGRRLVRTLDWTSRLSGAALGLSVAAVALGLARDVGWTVPLETAVARTFADVAPAETLETRARAALDHEDVALARGYADLAADLNRPLEAGTLERLAAMEAPGATAWRAMRGAAWGFATGETEGGAALAGAVAADFTVVGDVRDLVSEGGKIARGEEHSDLMLGLAAAGIAATAATVATAGVAAPAKFGVSVLKAAGRAGTLTAEFAADLGRRALKPVGGAPAAGRAAKSIDLAAMGKVGRELRAASATVGAGETVRLMKFVKSGDDLAELAPFTARFGTRSRAVAELTGRASLRAFRTTIRLAERLLAHLWAVLLWFGGLVCGALSHAGFRVARMLAARI
ncbi:hypothetical protein GCM10008171_23410 [Methylopila jiangsuensis]|uniref:Uncharacterized protein n=1 Tax=Methylopila jiangsuensis TaxID=586230 RepID=A0A9W6JH24_9HYPH|nr:hypothetical protein [Methylopila jiangsuensis]MDR6286573.1 hypothetical protein [Methylopila jiangsuensis]GLK77087.1 hypothetical protein GCM10008171_23410 [Methylopila jiangsuensis]